MRAAKPMRKHQVSSWRRRNPDSLVSYGYTVGKPHQERSNQPPVPSPWSRSGNVRFKRRTGSKRAETKVKLLSHVSIIGWRGRYCLLDSRQHPANRHGEICRTLPGSEGLASLMIRMSIEQLRSYDAWKKKQYAESSKETSKTSRCIIGSPTSS